MSNDFNFSQVENMFNSDEMLVTINTDYRTLTFNKAAMNALNNPRYVNVYYDIVRSVIAIKPIKVKEPGSYHVTFKKDGVNSSMCIARLISRIKMNSVQGAPLEKYKDMFIVRV